MGGVCDDLGGSISEFLLLLGTAIISHEFIVLDLLMLKPLRQSMHRALPLYLVQLGVLLHQEDARARLLYKVSNMLLTRVVRMLRELLLSALGDGDALTLRVDVAVLDALAVGIMNDVSHVLLAQSTHYAEEELALGQLVGELLLGAQVFGEHRAFMASS